MDLDLVHFQTLPIFSLEVLDHFLMKDTRFLKERRCFFHWFRSSQNGGIWVLRLRTHPHLVLFVLKKLGRGSLRKVAGNGPLQITTATASEEPSLLASLAVKMSHFLEVKMKVPQMITWFILGVMNSVVAPNGFNFDHLSDV